MGGTTHDVVEVLSLDGLGTVETEGSPMDLPCPSFRGHRVLCWKLVSSLVVYLVGRRDGGFLKHSVSLTTVGETSVGCVDLLIDSKEHTL